MTYYNRLHPWCIIRRLPNMQRTIIARFRKRNEAEAHRLNPDADYAIVFDPPAPQSDQPTSDQIPLFSNTNLHLPLLQTF